MGLGVLFGLAFELKHGRGFSHKVFKGVFGDETLAVKAFFKFPADAFYSGDRFQLGHGTLGATVAFDRQGIDYDFMGTDFFDHITLRDSGC